jgi:crossover junction endodeoxyribonuclease RuvC
VGRDPPRPACAGGRAGNTQVHYMVGILLTLQGQLQSDAADARAVAITHAHMREAADRLGLPPRMFR